MSIFKTIEEEQAFWQEQDELTYFYSKKKEPSHAHCICPLREKISHEEETEA